MIADRPVYHILKVSIEAESAHAIHTGEGDITHDTLILRDANGLPTLSGSSLAGVLKQEYQHQFGEQATKDLFGFVEGEDSQTSWVEIYWGFIHNSKNQALEGLLLPSELTEVKDIECNVTEYNEDAQLLTDKTENLEASILSTMLDKKPIVRQHVSINDRGVSKHAGKYDVTLVPAGARYSFWLSYWGQDNECQDDNSEVICQHWQNLINLFKIKKLRIGHGTQRGYGLFKTISLHQAVWNLKTPVGRQNFCAHNCTRMNYQGLQKIELDDKLLQENNITIPLKAVAGWRVGGGERRISFHTIDNNTKSIKDPDLLPMHEPRIKWTKSKDNLDTGTLGEQEYVLPASAITGTLRHRVAYHYNRLLGRFVDDDDVDKQAFETEDSPAVKLLFGSADSDEPNASILGFKDIYLDPNEVITQIVPHNKIDDYTSGVITGGLFSEQILWQTDIDITITVSRYNNIIDNNFKKNIKSALSLALRDMASGRLCIGASGAKGLGVFKLRQDDTKFFDQLDKKLDALFA
ncbi:RAMP superfamily CRISPR-associated protein [Psychrobacter sp. I-STPA6b]|uniref:RAMP superfamily CRISPR-associated protein n=1 Tax=Psychrobacter sp. I-STPA6b TaxID=2585718 RepID=UPI001D0C9160|nr:RAMP superfamily CRISPR-associated protein [Psychrobacter sp. I-STPA6b]